MAHFLPRVLGLARSATHDVAPIGYARVIVVVGSVVITSHSPHRRHGIESKPIGGV